jgi:hypothetical protein
MIAYDLDGTIVKKEEPFWLSILWKIFPMWASKITVALAKEPLLIPKKKAYIITGRGEQNYKATVAWLKKYKITNPLVMTMFKHTNRNKAMAWKRRSIILLHITTFYEDDKETIKYLSDLPNLRIIKIKHDK